MKSGFKDPIKHNERPKDHPKDGKNTPWDFTAPEYDQRSSCFVSAGQKHGVGHRQPVGHEGNPKSDSIIPKGRVNTMRIDEKD